MSVMIDALVRAWDRNLDYAKRLVADVPEDRFVYQPAPKMNHPAWLLSHLNLYHPVMLAMLTHGDFPDPRDHKHGMQSRAEPDASLYGTKHELIGAFERGHHEVSETLQTAGEGRLEAATPLERWRPIMPQIGHVMAYLMLVHESTHLGQISAWRRAQGMPGV